MGRKPCCSSEGLNRGAWSTWEDKILRDYINTHGQGKWRDLPKKAGLKRCGKSCRLRWLNYLRPDVKRGNISWDEEELIVRLHKLLGNRWSLIAGRLPGRTDNEIKNYWNTHLSKKQVSSPPSRCPGSDVGTREETKKVDVEACTEQSHDQVFRTKAPARCSKAHIPPDNNSSETTSTDDQRSTSSPFDTFLNLPIDFDIVEEFMAGFECTEAYIADHNSSIANTNSSEPTSTDQRSSPPPFDTFLDLPMDFDIGEEFMAGIERNSTTHVFDLIRDD